MDRQADFNFFDRFRLRVRGKDLDKWRRYFYGFEVEDRVDDPDVTCRSIDIDTDVDRYLGDPKEYYGRDGDRFVVKDYGSKLIVNPGWDEVTYSPSLPFYLVRKFVEGELRKKLMESGFGLMHASGVRYQDETILTPAWRHTGKTNTMLGFMSRGAAFLADDRLWVNGSGEVMGYPTPVNMLQYNFKSFPELSTGILTRLRGDVGSVLDGFFNDRSMRVFKGLDLVNQYWIKDRKEMKISDMFPDSDRLREARVDKLILLQSQDAGVELQKVGCREVSNYLFGINFHEWDMDLLDMSTAHDVLFPNRESRADEVRELMTAGLEVFSDLSNSVPTYKLMVPREEDWGEGDTTKKVVETITSC